MRINVLLLCSYVHHLLTYMVPMESRKGHQMPWNWSFEWLWVSMWILGTELWKSNKCAKSLSHLFRPWVLHISGIIHLQMKKHTQVLHVIHSQIASQSFLAVQFLYGNGVSHIRSMKMGGSARRWSCPCASFPSTPQGSASEWRPGSQILWLCLTSL